MSTENAGFKSRIKVFPAVIGTFFYAFGIKMFISGLGLYSGGVMGNDSYGYTVVSVKRCAVGELCVNRIVISDRYGAIRDKLAGVLFK